VTRGDGASGLASPLGGDTVARRKRWPLQRVERSEDGRTVPKDEDRETRLDHLEAIATLGSMLDTAPPGTFSEHERAVLRLAIAALDWEYRFG
jgi:hypothetical protein